MTDHNHSHDSGGGHEVDQPPTRELFNIVWGLSALTLVSLITCVQAFNTQARDIDSERGDVGSYMLTKYRKDQETRTRGTGKEELTDTATGKVVARYSYIPLASARDLILAKPEKLGAFPPPPGWIHPDDVAAGGQGGAATPPPAPTPAMAPTGGVVPPVGLPPVIPAGAPAAPAGTPPAVPPAGTPPVVVPTPAPAPVAPAPTPAPAAPPPAPAQPTK